MMSMVSCLRQSLIDRLINKSVVEVRWTNQSRPSLMPIVSLSFWICFCTCSTTQQTTVCSVLLTRHFVLKLLPTIQSGNPSIIPTIRSGNPSIIPTIQSGNPSIIPTIRSGNPLITRYVYKHYNTWITHSKPATKPCSLSSWYLLIYYIPSKHIPAIDTLQYIYIFFCCSI